jgi:hypothetical protein
MAASHYAKHVFVLIISLHCIVSYALAPCSFILPEEIRRSPRAFVQAVFPPDVPWLKFIVHNARVFVLLRSKGLGQPAAMSRSKKVLLTRLNLLSKLQLVRLMAGGGAWSYKFPTITFLRLYPSFLRLSFPVIEYFWLGAVW